MQQGDVLGGLVRKLLARADGLVERVIAEICAEEPGYAAAGSVPVEDLRQSCRDNVFAMLLQVGGRPDAFDAARCTGRRRAEQRLPLDTVLHSFRIGGRVIWEELALEARRIGPDAFDAMLAGATAVWTVVDRTSTQVADAYRDAERALQQADAARARAAVEALLAGRGAEPGVAAEAARTLGLPTGGGFAVAVADAGSHDDAATDALEAAGMICAWQRWHDQVVGIVALDGRDVETVHELLAGRAQGRVGISGEIDGLADVRRAHLQASTALATLPPGTTGTALLSQVLPLALVVSRADLAGQLVQEVLGDVLALPDAERCLVLDTIRAWLDANGSLSGTATALYCHRNTVLKRLRRIEVLIGRSVERTVTRVELYLALAAHELQRADR